MAGPGRPGPGKASPGRPGLAQAGHFFARGILLVSVSWYVGSVSPYCSAFATNVFDMTSQRFSVP